MTDASVPRDEAAPATPAYRGAVLAMLLLVYTFNFVDRQILSILAPAIREDLGLSKSEMGLLGGLAFALLYSTLAIPLSWLADRTSRTWVITASLAAWSGFTALCGLAGNFTQLFLCRLGVGVGEAGGVAPSYAVIADYFPAGSRARALAIYSLGIPLGSAAGVMAGGYIAQAVGLARRLHRGRACGRADRPAVPPRRARGAAGAIGGRRAAGEPGLRDPGAQEELLAARLRRIGQLDARLWPRLLAADAAAGELRARSGGDRELLWRGAAGRRRRGGAGGRRDRRPAGAARQGRLCAAARDRLRARGALVRGRHPLVERHRGLPVLRRAAGAGLCLARAGALGGPAPRPPPTCARPPRPASC